MSRQPSSRDFEKLSAYLDGELSASASRKMKSRLARDPNLLAALDDLRETKSVLQRIPKRRSLRSFKLTPQMVATRPPMPRAYPIFRFASAVAVILLFFSTLPNVGVPMGASAPMVLEAAPAAENFAGAEAEDMMEMPAPAAEAPALAESAPLEEPAAEEAASPEAPVTETEKSSADQRAEGTIIPTPTITATPLAKITTTPTPEPLTAPQTDASAQPASPQRIWQMVLAALAVFFGLGAFIVRRGTISKWQKASK